MLHPPSSASMAAYTDLIDEHFLQEINSAWGPLRKTKLERVVGIGASNTICAAGRVEFPNPALRHDHPHHLPHNALQVQTKAPLSFLHSAKYVTPSLVHLDVASTTLCAGGSTLSIAQYLIISKGDSKSTLYLVGRKPYSMSNGASV